MDEIVEAALRKWPNVPHCHGWLGLDARGDWYLRDERAQAAGAFPAVRGSLIEHAKLREFIARNYACDEAGCWYFQNGPQRVYVELEAAPWVWRLHPDGDSVLVRSHTGRDARIDGSCVDEHGRLFLAGPDGLGIVHTSDVELASRVIEAGTWLPEAVRFETLPTRYRYVPSPAAKHPATDDRADRGTARQPP
jgi:hypothetical protein